MSTHPSSHHETGGTETAGEIATRQLTKRLRGVEKLIEPAALRASEDIEYVHKLRVATRRSQAALDVFRSEIPKKLRKRIGRTLREVRRAAGAARDADVHQLAFEAMPEPASTEERAAISFVLERIADERETAQESLVEVHHAGTAETLRGMRDELESARRGDGAAGLAQLAETGVRGAAGAVEDATHADFDDIENLHTLRKRAKALRYTLELVSDALHAERSADLLLTLRAMQDGLGALNDQSSITDRLRRYLGDVERGLQADAGVERGLRSLIERFDRDLGVLQEASAQTWGGDEAQALIGDVLRLVEPERPAPVPAFDPASAALRASTGMNPNRMAAIDVGSNSLRLIIAELEDDGSYRVLDDEKEITRLGAGLAQTGRISKEAIERSVDTVKRMRDIATGYGVSAVRAVGTAVARDAENAGDLHRALLIGAGVELEIISPEREAQLAFRSVAAAFDLRDQAVAIVDIGGGSTEVVLSSRGLIETVYAIPMGAVRLTDQFGGSADSCGPRFDEMRGFIRGEIKRIVGKPPFVPQLMIGTGGTLTTLAEMLVSQQRGPLWAQSDSASVRGHEMQRADLRHLLERLRKMTLAERTRVPGLPAERADIIVAGLVIAECLMKRLGVNRTRVHDRGIRDGLLLEMAEQMRGCPESRRTGDAMVSVQRFAAACRYDHAHCAHVAVLALQVFDQLRAWSVRRGDGGEKPPSWAPALTDEARMVLEAAAVLQDVGYHINYTRHHKHSHHLILHADLQGFTSRQTRMIANVARYHRRGEPKLKHESFARLDAADRATVRTLAAILRVAGGLDRAHVQRVNAVRVVLDEKSVRFIAEAGEDPHVELWGASRKATLFEHVFDLKATFEWAPPLPGGHPVGESIHG